MTKTEIKGFVFKLHPNSKQANDFDQTFGCVRKVRNELLGDIKEGRKRSIPDIKSEYSYTKDRDSQAYTSMWKFLMQGIKDYSKGHKGFPRFSRKYDTIQSYTTNKDTSNLTIKGNKIYLRKVGWVKVVFHRELPLNSRVKAATIKREAGEYYISLRVEYRNEIEEQNKDYEWMIGLDYSPSNLYVDQNGNSPVRIKAFLKEIKIEEEKVRKISKELSRKERGSNNWKKVKQKLQKQHKHIANKRKDFYHKESRRLVNLYNVVVIEDLDLKSMGEKPKYNPEETIDFKEATKAKRRRKAMFKAGYRLFTNMLKYKLKDDGKKLIQVHKYYPSTKTCPMCKHKQEMDTSIRVYKCGACGHEMNRDQNAAYNLIDEGFMIQLRETTKIDKMKWISV